MPPPTIHTAYPCDCQCVLLQTVQTVSQYLLAQYMFAPPQLQVRLCTHGGATGGRSRPASLRSLCPNHALNAATRSVTHRAWSVRDNSPTSNTGQRICNRPGASTEHDPPQ
eukprot:10046906-Alexandrium_andersonii.AAC.1